MKPNNGDENKALTPSEWGRSLKIPDQTIQEVTLFSDMGWAMDNNNKSRQLSIHEKKMVALACVKTGLSVMGKQVIFLGNSLYVTKGGKIAMARKDKDRPLAKIEVRPATETERQDYGVVHNDPTKPLECEHLWFAEIYALFNGDVMKVSDAYGHACVSNIKLYGKEKDPRRYCADMASTRAVSRALTLAYDFFGFESWEEVGLQPGPVEASYTIEDGKTATETVKNIIAEKAEEVALPETLEKVSAGYVQVEGGDEPVVPVTAIHVLQLMEEHVDSLPEGFRKKYPDQRVMLYGQEALDGLKDKIERFALPQGGPDSGETEEIGSETGQPIPVREEGAAG